MSLPSVPATMRAVVATRPGTPDVLEVRQLPVPQPRAGWVLIRVRAFGLNRAELFTRQGDSPGVEFPRVLGIEAVGEVVAAPGGEFEPGVRVVSLMGEMGRAFDGGYAEYTLVPAGSAFAADTTLPWEVLGALPEMFQTADGSLRRLAVGAGDTLLIRGGTSSVGLCAARIAADQGVRVLATSRDPGRFGLLRQNGVHVPLHDSPQLAAAVKAKVPEGVDGVLELVGASTIPDSLSCVRPGGTVCMTGILGGEWVLNGFDVFSNLASGARLTCYSGTSGDLDQQAFASYLREIEAGRISPARGRTYRLEEVPQAHRDMEANRAVGKLVIVP